MKVWMHPSAYHGDGRHTGFLERYMVATREESIEIEFVVNAGDFPGLQQHIPFPMPVTPTVRRPFPTPAWSILIIAFVAFNGAIGRDT